MTARTQECAEWFREHPAFHRLLVKLRDKFRRYGSPLGMVSLPDASEEECEAARLVLGRDFVPPLQFRTIEFEVELQRSQFGRVNLKEVLGCYFQEEIKTPRELREEEEQRYADLFDEARKASQTDLCRQWVDALDERRAGSDTLKRAAKQNMEDARHALLRACKSIDLLQQQREERLRLAVLSAQAVGDPHALDRGTLCGRLFLHALAFCAGKPLPASAEEKDALYFQNGILCDSISSCVTQVGLLLGVAEEEHPAYQAFRMRHETCTLTLSGVSRLTWAHSPSGRVYLVENEGVFCQLCDRSERFHSPLVCTSGQPSVAVLRLLELLAASGTELFYSGDFDGKGLSIAALLTARWPQNVHLWHFSPADYACCCSKESLGKNSCALLEGCTGTILEETAQEVSRCGLAGYQELLLPQLEADLTETP